jgi:hypothetical protein
MDGSAFDRLVRHIGEDASRRGVFRSVLAATVAGLGVGTLLGDEDAGAKKKSCKQKCNKFKGKKKRECKKKCNCRSENASCNGPEGTRAECCAHKNLVCDVPFGAGNSDLKCCRGAGASCSTDPGGPQCCTGEGGEREYTCVGGICQCAGAGCAP